MNWLIEVDNLTCDAVHDDFRRLRAVSSKGFERVSHECILFVRCVGGATNCERGVQLAGEKAQLDIGVGRASEGQRFSASSWFSPTCRRSPTGACL
ncbi:hypothetical protein YK56LOC_19560 [Caballeronia sp. HLA56]